LIVGSTGSRKRLHMLYQLRSGGWNKWKIGAETDCLVRKYPENQTGYFWNRWAVRGWSIRWALVRGCIWS